MILILAVVTKAAPLVAHRAFAPRQVNRYGLITISENEVRFEYLVYFGALPAIRVKSQWDQNRNGVLEADETRRGTEVLRKQLASALIVQIDGKPVPAATLRANLDLQGDRRVHPSAFTLKMEGAWALSGSRPHKLLFNDTAGRLPMLDPVGEIHIEIRPQKGIRLLESHTGTWSSGIAKKLSFRGRPSAVEDRRISVRWAPQTNRDSPPGTKHGAGVSRDSAASSLQSILALLITALMGLLGLGGTWYWLRRRKKRQSP